MRNSHCARREVVLIAIDRLVNIGIDMDTFAVSASPIRLYGSIGSGIADIFSADFCRYLLPIQPKEEIQYFI